MLGLGFQQILLEVSGVRTDCTWYMTTVSGCPPGFHYCELLRKTIEMLGIPQEGQHEDGDSPRKAKRKPEIRSDRRICWYQRRLFCCLSGQEAGLPIFFPWNQGLGHHFSRGMSQEAAGQSLEAFLSEQMAGQTHQVFSPSHTLLLLFPEPATHRTLGKRCIRHCTVPFIMGVIKTTKLGLQMESVVEHLLRMQEGLSLIPSTTKTNKRNQKPL